MSSSIRIGRVCAIWLIFSLLVLVGGCTRPDPTIALGKWRAEAYQFGGFKIPIPADFEVTRSEVRWLSPTGEVLQSLPLEAIRATKDTIELDVKDGYGVGFKFAIETRDRLVFVVPVIGKTVTFLRRQ